MSENLTISEKILSRASGGRARAGDYVWARPDLIYIHDVLGPLALRAMKEMGTTRPAYSGKLVFVSDHIFPPKDSASADNILFMKRNAEELGATFIKEGEGIEHTLLIEKGVISPGQLVMGGDSHTVTAGAVGAMGVGFGSTDIGATLAMGTNWFMVPETIRVEIRGKFRSHVSGKDIILSILGRIGADGANYRTLEIFPGEEGSSLDLDGRLAVSNMTAEAGAKAGIVVPDDVVADYYRNAGYDASIVLPDPGASYIQNIDVDLDQLEPQIAAPYSPANVHPVSEFEGTRIDQAYIGNCANGTLSDLREAAEVLRGRSVHESVKLIVVPATRTIYSRALEEGLIKTFIESGASVSPPTCGACAGLHMGVLGDGEVAISNTNRNYRGRMGHPGSKVFLSNTYVAAASAIEGRITGTEGS